MHTLKTAEHRLSQPCLQDIQKAAPLCQTLNDDSTMRTMLSLFMPHLRLDSQAIKLQCNAGAALICCPHLLPPSSAPTCCPYLLPPPAALHCVLQYLLQPPTCCPQSSLPLHPCCTFADPCAAVPSPPPSLPPPSPPLPAATLFCHLYCSHHHLQLLLQLQ